MAAILADRMVAITGEHVPLVQARGSGAVARCRFPAAAGAIAAMAAPLDGDRWQRIAQRVEGAPARLRWIAAVSHPNPALGQARMHSGAAECPDVEE